MNTVTSTDQVHYLKAAGLPSNIEVMSIWKLVTMVFLKTFYRDLMICKSAGFQLAGKIDRIIQV